MFYLSLLTTFSNGDVGYVAQPQSYTSLSACIVAADSYPRAAICKPGIVIVIRRGKEEKGKKEKLK